MSEEEVVDCVIEIDKVLSEVESALDNKEYKKALRKVKEARGVIEDLREDDESVADRQEVEMDVMNKLK